MATWSSSTVAEGYPVYQPNAGEVAVAYGSYTWEAGSAGPAITDTIALCKLPPNAIVLDTVTRAGDVDTNATETFDFDLGLASDTDAYGNNGVFTGDAIAEIKPEVGIQIRGGGLLQSAGPQSVGTSPVTVIATVVAAPATFNTNGATFSTAVFYTMPVTTTGLSV